MYLDYVDVKEYDLKGKKVFVIIISYGVLNVLGEMMGDLIGVFVLEMMVFYYEFLDVGMEVDVVSIKGGEILIDL